MTEDVRADNITLLDIAVIIAESWKLLVILPLAVALVAFAVFSIGNVEPAPEIDANISKPRFTATTVLRISTDAFSYLGAADGRREMAESFQETEAGSEDTVSAFLSSYRLRFLNNDWGNYGNVEPGVVFVQFEMTRFDLDFARASLEHVISRVQAGDYYDAGKVALQEDIATLERTVESLRSAISSADEISAQTDTEEATGVNLVKELMQADLIQRLAEYEARLSEQKARLLRWPNGVQVELIQYTEGSSEGVTRVYVSPLPRAVLAGLAVGVLTLVFVFLREGFRRAARRPESQEKVERIRRAFSFRPSPPQSG